MNYDAEIAKAILGGAALLAFIGVPWIFGVIAIARFIAGWL